MKKLLVFLFIGVNALPSQAQGLLPLKLDSVVDANQSKRTHTYLGDGAIESIYYQWENATASWEPALKTTHQFPDNEYIYTQYFWKPETQSWRPDERFIQVFDSEGNQIAFNLYYWKEFLNDWKEAERCTLRGVIDSVSHLEDVCEVWDNGLNDWRNDDRWEYWLTPSGKTSESIHYEWINNAWRLYINSYQHKYFYDANDRLASSESYSFWNAADSVWTSKERSVYFYNPNGTPDAADAYGFDEDLMEWVYSRRQYEIDYFYNQEGRIGEKIVRVGNNNSPDLTYSTREFYEYDIAGNVTVYSRYNWNIWVEAWYGSYKEVNAYDLFVDPADLIYPRDYASLFQHAKLDYRETYSLNVDNDWQLESEMTYYFSEVLTDTDEAPASEALKLFPNPVSNLLTLGANAPRASSYQITDLNGRILQQEKTWNGDGIDVSRLIPGSYVIRLIEGNRVITGKFVKL